MDLSISIVSFNTRDLLLHAIQSVYDHAGALALEIIVVDNASTDGSADAVRQHFPTVRLVSNAENRLFTAAHNQAFALSEGDFVLILNSDIVFRDSVLERMVHFLRQNPAVGGLGSRLWYADDRLQPDCSTDYSLELAFYNFTFLGKAFPGRAAELNRRTFYADWDRKDSRSVAVVPDSLLMVRHSLFGRGVPLYDERLSLYFTENDLCRRIRALGASVWYLSDGLTLHHVSQSVNRMPPAWISRIYRRDIRRYFAKWHGRFLSALLASLIELTRAVIAICQKLGIRRFKRNLVWGTP